MKVRMDWKKLLKPQRFAHDLKTYNPDRSEFQRDFDRIIFSEKFRRLHGKTQVFPFPETDLIHNRLTHSLEVSSVGRSLGTIVGNKLHEKNPFIQGWEMGQICSAACLAHDIGNPPFGHTGEDAISEYFNSNKGMEMLKDLSAEEREDFLQFEGNAMGFHILTHSNRKKTKVRGGFSLTYPTLAAFTKYPRPSVIIDKKDRVSEDKYGIFQCDLDTYKEIAFSLGIPYKKEGDRWYRHPLSFLTEAADDICYVIMDLEDGYKNGLVTYEKAAHYLISIAHAESGNTTINSLDKIIDREKKIAYLRAKAINSLANQTAGVFLDNEDKILTGEFDEPITTMIESYQLLKEILELSREEIYTHKPVIQIGAAGFQVLPGLLDTFLSALKDNKKSRSKMILKLLPDEYIFDFQEEPYEAIMSITGYIAGMTDTFAVDTYRNLMGIKLPNY